MTSGVSPKHLHGDTVHCPETPGAQHPPVAQTRAGGCWSTSEPRTRRAWLEEDFLGYGATELDERLECRNLSLVAESGFHIGRGERVETQEANGHEKWLWVLARRP